ncbi:MAG: FHA domain-containing protein, partial [Parachlamydiaceae bacterium]|nr:FHA domain-containing protein [Parachlamydiaceae bacterium]
MEEPFEDDDVDIPHDSIFSDESSDKDAIAQINFGLIDTGRWLLKVISGPNNGAEFSMATDSSYLLGTDPNSCDIVFHDTSVSRQHARISIAQDDTLTVEDLKSRNGTTVDGESLLGKQPLA